MSRGARGMIGVLSITQYRIRLQRIAREQGTAIVEDERPLFARIEHDRWLADCPNCNAGIAIEPEWPAAACLDVSCCRWFTTVVVPANRAALEAALKARPREINRNWRPGESLEDLERENRALLR